MKISRLLQDVLDEQTTAAERARKPQREAQIALVALDDEKRDMSRKHRELLAAVEKKKEDIMRSGKEQLATKDQESAALKSEVSKVKIEVSKVMDDLAKAREASEAEHHSKPPMANTTQSIPVTPGSGTPPSPNGVHLSKLEFTVRTLTKEKDALRTKLKDRGTTIAALVKSSVSLENKISTMESEIHDARSVRSEEKKLAEGALSELRKTLDAMKAKEPKMSEEVESLKTELESAKKDANRWKRELQNDGASSSEYRFQIALLRKELDDSVERLKERDQDIENLVNQSMMQESHVRDFHTRISSLMEEVETVPSQRCKYDDSLRKAEI